MKGPKSTVQTQRSSRSMASRFAMALVNFGVAMPLLVAVLGPFHLRRLRRDLRAQLQEHDCP